MKKVESYTETEKDVLYCICQSGMRSEQAVRKLQKNGYNLVNVQGVALVQTPESLNARLNLDIRQNHEVLAIHSAEKSRN